MHLLKKPNMTYKTGCLICGKELVYLNNDEDIKCYYCNKIYNSNVRCVDGHFICDKCHSLSAFDLIEEFCINTALKNPIEIALILMRNEKIKMHGPEHHFLVPTALLAAYYNIKVDKNQKIEKIKKARERAKNILGGFCGFYGACGAGIGTGLFISLLTDATPLSKNEWRLSNLMTSKSLFSIANNGGPRCCKRTSFLSIIEATKFLNEFFDIKIDTNITLHCEFNTFNKECLKKGCPFY